MKKSSKNYIFWLSAGYPPADILISAVPTPWLSPYLFFLFPIAKTSSDIWHMTGYGQKQIRYLIFLWGIDKYRFETSPNIITLWSRIGGHVIHEQGFRFFFLILTFFKNGDFDNTRIFATLLNTHYYTLK